MLLVSKEDDKVESLDEKKFVSKCSGFPQGNLGGKAVFGTGRRP